MAMFLPLSYKCFSFGNVLVIKYFTEKTRKEKSKRSPFSFILSVFTFDTLGSQDESDVTLSKESG